MRRRFLFNKNVEKSLVITANEPSTVRFNVYALRTCEYNLNNTGWVKYTTTTHSLNTGETISFRGDLIISSTALERGVGRFIIDGNVDLYGSPIYLLAEQFLKKGIFEYLFAHCDIRNVSSTFLPTTTLASECYLSMFEGCTSLATAPALPATTLAQSCYYNMFKSCTALTTAPELPATTLASNCYQSMFSGCTKLNYIKMLATDISATYCLDDWVNGVASIGTFIKNPAMTSLPTGISGIPSGWTVVNDGEE